jgi:small subunit ribosomal protein S15
MMSKVLIQKSQIYKDNPGCTEAQIFNLTEKVVRLSSHLKNHNKDYASQRGLKKILGQRKRLLSYLYRQDNRRYEDFIAQLGIRAAKKM